MNYQILIFAFALFLVPPSVAQDIIPLASPEPRSPGHFGGSVAGISDIDGDGRGDLIVGADWEAGLAGHVHLFSGATGSFIRTLESPSPKSGGNFGLEVSSVPDLDNDGVADVLVGTSTEETTGTGKGRVHVFSGATGSLVYTLTSPNPETSGVFPSFGGSVTGTDDIDGDGRGDILVGARAEDTGDAGRAYLFSGASGDTLRSFSSPNAETNGYFGFRVASVPDADGDSVPDLIIGAHTEDANALTNAGRVYLFSGDTGALLHTFLSPTPTSNGLFGRDIEGIPDVDGDGRGDVIIGASREATGGRVYVFSGNTGSLIHTIDTPNTVAAGSFGGAVGVVTDVNGDSISDILIGATGEYDGLTLTGRAYVFSGATGELLSDILSPNPKSSGLFGYSIAGVPDANGNGIGDILVGAVQEDGTSATEGRAYLVAGAMPVSNEPGPSRIVNSLDVYPNPATKSATVRLDASRAEQITLKLFDILGREVATVHNGAVDIGTNTLGIDVKSLPTGIYMLTASTSSGLMTKAFVVAK